MFTIDLLKGQGIPIKSKPGGIAVVAVTFAVPLIVTIVMLGFYLHSRVVISVRRQEIVNYEAKIGKLSDAVELHKSFEREKNVINSCLAEVASSIGKYSQWSPILMTLVRNMPSSVVLTKLEVKQGSVRRKVPKQGEPGKTVEKSVPAKVLHMSVSGSPQYNCDKAVRDFKDRLRFSDFLGPKLHDIRVSQRFDTIGKQDLVSYDMVCIFKPSI